MEENVVEVKDIRPSPSLDSGRYRCFNVHLSNGHSDPVMAIDELEAFSMAVARLAKFKNPKRVQPVVEWDRRRKE